MSRGLHYGARWFVPIDVLVALLCPYWGFRCAVVLGPILATGLEVMGTSMSDPAATSRAGAVADPTMFDAMDIIQAPASDSAECEDCTRIHTSQRFSKGVASRSISGTRGGWGRMRL